MSDRDKSASREAGSRTMPITSAVYGNRRGKGKDKSPRRHQTTTIEQLLSPAVVDLLRGLQ